MRVRHALIICLATALVASASVWHHIRIQQFVQAFAKDLRGRLPRGLRRQQPDLETSVLRLSSARGPVVYQLRVRHKARLLELSAETRDQPIAAQLEGRLPELKALVGAGVEIERPSRVRTRVVDAILLNPDLGTPISRSLTDEQASDAAERMGRLVSIVEQILAGR